MMLSKTSKYAFQIMMFLGMQKEEKVGISQIQEFFGGNTSYILKVFQTLVQKELLISKKGPQGGFSLRNKNTTLFDVLVALEGEETLKQCGFRSEECNSEKPCPLHIGYSKQRYEFCEYLKEEKVCQ